MEVIQHVVIDGEGKRALINGVYHLAWGHPDLTGVRRAKVTYDGEVPVAIEPFVENE